MNRLHHALIWAGFLAVIGVPLVLAATSPLLAWRQPIYVAAGFAGVLGMAVLLAQPLLVTGVLPGLSGLKGRRAHRWVGGLLVGLIVVHVVGLWITSPPDMIDALTFTSPTPFSPWGVIAMWAIFGAAGLAIYRARMRLPIWRIAHSALVVIVVIGSVVHAMLIEGTMEIVSKAAVSAIVLIVTGLTIAKRRAWAPFMPKRTRR
ncbi:ferric reductase-like transmembrane domain-containing protein [Actibacterium pelagium]|uniref:Ferric reductase n=1 Tax=Actibacterium pelagium TaxID=2029103 RepID=A0A917EJ86_9RHOB|nr:ferric reductase-like transmembrane domain-containing protein [Actibacterium pelagium]GGE49987.1 ferric reductase [Actibacterium pelagium]